MRIAFVLQPIDRLLPPYQNSIGIWTYQVAKHLSSENDLTLFVSERLNSWDTGASANDNWDTVLVPSLPLKAWQISNRIFSRFRGTKKPFYTSIWYQAEYLGFVAREISKRQFDVIHVQNMPQAVSIIRRFNTDAKIVLHMHSEWLSQLDEKLMSKRINDADLVIGCSEYITQKVRDRFPQYAERCQTVFNGVDLRNFTISNETKGKSANGAAELLFVGRISPEKGIHVLIEAFIKVAEQHPAARLTLVGPIESVPADFIVKLSDDAAVNQLAIFYEGVYLDHLQRRIPDHLSEQVTFVGSVSYGQVVEHYKKADVLVNPSFSESFGMSLVEAMACQVPVVAARVGGMVDVVDEGKTGLFVEPGDANELATAVSRILNDKEKSDAMGRAGRRRVEEHFSWERIASDLSHQYECLVH